VGGKFNPLIFAGIDLTGGGGAGYWADAVATEGDLPASGAFNGETRVVLDTDHVYIWDTTTTQWIDTGITSASVGSSPNSAGYSLGTSISGNVTHNTLVLQPANASNPGVVTTGSQSIAGNKTFSGSVIADGGIDVTSAGASDTLNIGSGATINIQGTTSYQDVTNLNVTDKLITINDGGSAGSGGGSGLEVEENASITGYNKTSSDRNSWELKAPNTAGIAIITPGSGGITLNQSSHDAVTLGSVGSSPNVNGASLSGQVLTLQPADGTNPGILTTGSQTIAGAKTFSGSISASNLSGTNTGDVTILDTNSVNLSLTGQQVSADVRRSDSTIAEDSSGIKVGSDSITNTHINSAAAIAYSKLNLSTSIVNADVSGSAAIAYSKLNLSSSIVNADVSNSAAIAYSKLNLSGSIVNADITNSTIDLTTKVTGTLPNSNTTATSSNTNSAIVARDGSGNFSAGTITASLTGVASGNLVKSSGDINQTSFSASNNQVAAADVTGFAFANGAVRSFRAIASVYIDATSDLYESFIIHGLQKASDWVIDISSIGDASGISFSITSAGQIQYVSNSYPGFVSATINFRAESLGI
jgi:hypothetical protein